MSSNHADASAKVLDASDYYAIFDLDQASELQSEGAKKALRSKWRELTKLTHTDKSHDPRGEDAFKQLQEAYKTLSNDEEREQYDATLARANSRASEIVGDEDAARVAEIKEEIRRLVKSAAREALQYVRQALEWEGNHQLPMRVTMHFVGACGTADAAEADGVGEGRGGFAVTGRGVEAEEAARRQRGGQERGGDVGVGEGVAEGERGADGDSVGARRGEAGQRGSRARHERAGGDRGATGESVGARERQDAGADLGERAWARQ
jgi:curved DNA-binding protein CbpA